MKVLVAGASGAIGTRLVPQLIDAGHEVIGTHKSLGNAGRVRAMGAEPLQLDLLDPDAVHTAIVARKPEAIIHQATALAGDLDFKNSTAASTRRACSAPRERTRCLPRRRPPASIASWRRATRA